MPFPIPKTLNRFGGFGVWGLGFGVWGLGFGVWGLGFGVWGLGFGVWGLGFGLPRDWPQRCRVYCGIVLGHCRNSGRSFVFFFTWPYTQSPAKKQSPYQHTGNTTLLENVEGSPCLSLGATPVLRPKSPYNCKTAACSLYTKKPRITGGQFPFGRISPQKLRVWGLGCFSPSV